MKIRVENRSIDDYEDIIELPHHVSDKHKQMSIEDRAMQFAPFAALTGYEQAINDKEREVKSNFRSRSDF